MYEKKAIKENKAPPLISPCLPELYMLYPAVVEAINITYRSLRCFPSVVRREERQKIRTGKKTSSGMIACQDKWHPSALAQLHIHLPLAASLAYREVGGGVTEVDGGFPAVDVTVEAPHSGVLSKGNTNELRGTHKQPQRWWIYATVVSV